MTTIGSLCSGYGGLDIGLMMGTGGEVIWHAEIDPAASAVLARHHPDVPNLGSAIGRDWSTTASPDVLCAGFPCQPVSSAGRQLANADPRWLWPAVREALAPPVVFLENVRNIIAIRKGEILALILDDLQRLGYRYRWTILGACAVGAAHHRHRWFLRADRLADGESFSGERVMVEQCGARRSKSLPTPRASDTGTSGRAPGEGWRPALSAALLPVLLPSPTARDGDGRGEGDERYWSTRAATRTNGMPLGAAVALLPTPNATDAQGGVRELPAVRTNDGPDHGPRLRDVAPTLLPTPTARDGVGGPWLGAGGGLNLRTVAQLDMLLPSPRASDGERGRGNPNQHGGRGDLVISSAVQPQRFGAFAPAVERHALAFGTPPPDATEPNKNERPRLSAAFVEWMMGLPSGYVTDGTNRNDALRLLGNGAVPQQVAAAWHLLSQPREGTQMTDQTPETAPTKSAAPPTPDPIFSAAEVDRILAFHGTPVAAQVLREVLGSLARTAEWASRKQPKNRPEELREWNPPHLRQLAALCRLYAPEVGSRTSELESADADLFPDATSPERETMTIGSGDGIDVVEVPTETEVREREQAAEVAAIEQGVLAERNGGHVTTEQATQILAAALGAEPIAPPAVEVTPPGVQIYAPDQDGWLAAATPEEHAAPEPWDVSGARHLITSHRPDPDGLDGPPF